MKVGRSLATLLVASFATAVVYGISDLIYVWPALSTQAAGLLFTTIWSSLFLWGALFATMLPFVFVGGRASRGLTQATTVLVLAAVYLAAVFAIARQLDTMHWLVVDAIGALDRAGLAPFLIAAGTATAAIYIAIETRIARG